MYERAIYHKNIVPAVIALSGALALAGCSSDISSAAKLKLEVHKFGKELQTGDGFIFDEANIRTSPETLTGQDPSSFDNICHTDGKAIVFDSTTVMALDPEHDANGYWLEFNADDLGEAVADDCPKQVWVNINNVSAQYTDSATAQAVELH